MRALPAFICAAGTLLLAACHTAAPPPASQYQPVVQLPPVGLSFAPGAVQPPYDQVRQLRAITRNIPEQIVPVLYTSGSLAAARMAALERDIQRPLQLVLRLDSPPNQALMAFPATAGIVADDCRGPGAKVGEDISPGEDRSLPRILPPGCATASDIAAQVTDKGDLLYGRPLPPGAALPFARAAERYYDRDDTTSAAGQGSGGSGGSSGASARSGTGNGSTSAAAQQDPGGANSGWGYGQGQQNPLLAPLPPAQAQH
jgi:hypothetical protein